jgi:hypothetical protein
MLISARLMASSASAVHKSLNAGLFGRVPLILDGIDHATSGRRHRKSHMWPSATVLVAADANAVRMCTLWSIRLAIIFGAGVMGVGISSTSRKAWRWLKRWKVRTASFRATCQVCFSVLGGVTDSQCTSLSQLIAPGAHGRA